jgi:membrane fusion protein, multidrug efflux system
MPTEPSPPVVSRRKLGIYGAVGIVAALMLVISGIRAREDTSAKLREWTDNQAIPPVAVIYAESGALTATIDLPGRLEAYYRAPIFARVNGYLKGWSADIGARVKAGEVIAEIDAPDLDQQLLQARADLANQQASAKLSEVTLGRRKSLIASNFVSMQEIDERTADLSNKNAAVNASQANVERLEALAGYKKITAPFDGIVTARSTDVGALINAGGGSGPPMFVISDIRKLRVYVNVPQNYVPSVRIGARAVISVPEYRNRTFDATIEASAQSVDVNSGTTQMQLALDNAAGELMPGGFATVRLNLQRDGTPLHIPSSALIFNQSGLRVATVGPDDRVVFKTVTIARDLGRDIELASGITLEDRIINAPPDGIVDGDQVRVVSTKGRPSTVSTKQGEKG